MIKVEHLTKQFGRTRAVDDLSFEVARGEIVGFLGPNGAGKTTTMRMLTGFLPATAGTVQVDGLDVYWDTIEVRRRIGYLPESMPLYPELRVVEYLRYRGRLKGLHGRRLRAAVDGVLECCGLVEARRTLIGRLSKGFRQRVGLADSLVHGPQVLILDEPTIGLDPNQIRQIRNLIKALGGYHTVLLSSHILSEVESVCQRVLILNRGRIVASGTPAELVGLIKGSVNVVAEVRGPATDVRDGLRQIPNVRDVRVAAEGEWGRFVCVCESADGVGEGVFAMACRNGWMVRELRQESLKLEDAFAAMTREEPEAPAGIPEKGAP